MILKTATVDWNKGGVQDDLWKKVFFVDLLENQCLYEVYHTSLTTEMRKKVDVSKYLYDGVCQYFLEKKEVSFEKKRYLWSIFCFLWEKNNNILLT